MSTEAGERRIGGTLTGIVEEYWWPELVDEMYRGHAQTSPEAFRGAFHAYLGGRGRLLLAGSARQALNSLLKRLPREDGRAKVLLSSYNCAIVGDAVTKAGLEFETFDFSGPLGQFDWSAIGRRLGGEHLAIVVPHFFGIPTDFRELLPIARQARVWVIEDCAHTLGGSIAGVAAGQLGDASIFSFNYDKPISLAGGGALLVNNEAIVVERSEFEIRPEPDVEYRQFQKLLAVLRHSRSARKGRDLWSRVGARLGIGPLARIEPPSGIGPLRSALGLWLLERYDEVRERRNRNAAALRRELGEISWHVALSVTPAHLRHRVVVDESTGASAVRYCLERGIYVANANWPTLIGAPEDGARTPNAFKAATRGLDVPLHQNLSQEMLRTIIDAFRPAAAAH